MWKFSISEMIHIDISTAKEMTLKISNFRFSKKIESNIFIVLCITVI